MKNFLQREEYIKNRIYQEKKYISRFLVMKKQSINLKGYDKLRSKVFSELNVESLYLKNSPYIDKRKMRSILRTTYLRKISLDPALIHFRRIHQIRTLVARLTPRKLKRKNGYRVKKVQGSLEFVFKFYEVFK